MPPLFATLVVSTVAALSGCGGAATATTTVTVTSSTTVTVTAAAPPPTARATDGAPLDLPRPSTAPATPTDAGHAGPPPADDAPPDLAADLDAALHQVDGPGMLGIALAPVGGGPVVVAGPEQRNLAWSTIKVPIAVAALAGSDGDSTRALARRAVTVSDNAAAQALFLRAGSDAVEDVVRELGDHHTHVDPVKYGRTSWELRDQVRFAAGLPCRAIAAPVLHLMGQIDPGQRWGLGRLDGARFKGGWGPQTDGFVARQLGVLDAGDRGQVAVAVMSRTPGGMTDATRDLDRIAEILRARIDQLPAGHCDDPAGTDRDRARHDGT